MQPGVAWVSPMIIYEAAEDRATNPATTLWSVPNELVLMAAAIAATEPSEQRDADQREEETRSGTGHGPGSLGRRRHAC